MSTNNNTKIRTAKDIPSHVAMSFALFKAQGYSWEKISQGTKINIAILEDIPWAYPKEWARSYAYAEKLVAQETLAETLASLRQELPNADGRMKTQLANTITRLLALQHTRRTSRKHSTFNPLAKPNAIQTPQPPLAPCSIPVNSSPPSPKPTTVPQSTGPIAAVLLFLALWCGFGGQSKDAVASPNQSPDCLQPAVKPTRVFGSKAMDEHLAHAIRWEFQIQTLEEHCLSAQNDGSQSISIIKRHGGESRTTFTVGSQSETHFQYGVVTSGCWTNDNARINAPISSG